MSRIRILVVAASLAVGAAACGGGADDAAGPDRPPCPVGAHRDAADPVTITVWHVLKGLPLRTLERTVEAYEASQDQVRVELEAQGSGVVELSRKIDQAAPDRSLPAMVMPDDTKLRWAADSGLLLPAQACFDADPEAAKVLDDLLPIVRASYSLDDQLWPASFSTGTALVYYNRAHFEAAGLDPDVAPTTIDAMIEDGRALKAAGVSEAPVVLKAQPWIFEWWLTGAGQSIVDRENGRTGLATRSTFDNPVTRTILEKLRKAEEEGIVKVTPSTEGNSDHVLAMATQSSSMVLEASGGASTIAGIIEGTIDAADVKSELGVDVPDGLKLDLDIGVGPLPGVEEAGVGQVGGLVWYLTSTVPPEQQAAAWDFATFLNEHDAQLAQATDGSAVPSLRSITQDPELDASWSESLAGRWQRIAADVLPGIDPEFPGPVIGPYDEVRSAVGKALDRVLLDGDSIDRALTEADRTITASLDAYREDVEG